MSILPVSPAAEIGSEVDSESRWLIEGLWSEQAVGVVGGEPKSCKSFLALDMAVAVASGAPCLGQFRVQKTGRVLLFAAEDALGVVRERLEGICARAGAGDLCDLDIQVITSPSLRLDLEPDQGRLLETVDAYRPALLVLDPFVRLHRVDENVSAQVVPILAYLRELQRRFGCALVVVHHAKKGAVHERAGQALRGSSEVHAWVDSLLYLRRSGEQEIALSVEHRAAASPSSLVLRLDVDGPRLVVASTLDADVANVAAPSPSTGDRVITALRDLGGGPVTLRELRAQCRMRTATISDLLARLIHEQQVRRTTDGYALRAPAV